MCVKEDACHRGLCLIDVNISDWVMCLDLGLLGLALHF